MATRRNTLSKKQNEAVEAKLTQLPGHYIRRLQQVAVAIFMDETQAFGITPVQFAALAAVQQQPDIDQRTLAQHISFDTSTIGGVIDRLEARGLMLRNASPDDKRVRLLSLTSEGEKLLRKVNPAMQRAQERILQPLSQADKTKFMKLVKLLVDDAVGERGVSGEAE
jgi:MarR family transcriptional regulator, lower aerobic nicotinate degradation pathway regulator